MYFLTQALTLAIFASLTFSNTDLFRFISQPDREYQRTTTLARKEYAIRAISCSRSSAKNITAHRRRAQRTAVGAHRDQRGNDATLPFGA